MESRPAITTGKACDACRWRKLKCSKTAPQLTGRDTLDPRCSRCIKTGLRCTYNNAHGKRGPKTGRRLNALRAAQNAETSHSGASASPKHMNSPQDSQSSQDVSPNDPPLLPLEDPPQTFSSTNESQREQTANLDDDEAPAQAQLLLLEDEIQSSESIATSLGPSGDRRFYSMLDLQPWALPMENFLFSNEDLLTQLDLFFRNAYASYPIIHFDTVINRINQNHHLSDPDFRALVLSIVVINEACKFRRAPEHGTATMDILTKNIENLRATSHGYHFSENPSIDAVIVSLNLFIAYNVSNKHNRAFCYLTEAIGLFDLIEDSTDMIEVIRMQRLEYILFNTESASVSIYGSRRKRLISRRPNTLPATVQPLLWYTRANAVEMSVQTHLDFDLVQLDRRAVELLFRMTKLHLAKQATEVASVTLDDLLLTTVAEGFDGVRSDSSLNYDTQTADVAITRQWKLAEYWWMSTSSRTIPISSTTALKGTIQMIATTALTWSRTIQPNNLRIVGLGKLANLTDAILKISSELGFMDGCSNLIGDLIQTVAEPDYERLFAPQLSMTELYIGNIPRSIMSNEDLEQFLDQNHAG